MPRTDLQAAAGTASRLCEIVANTPLCVNVQVTCSIGVAQFRPGVDTADSLFERVDKAMYRSEKSE